MQYFDLFYKAVRENGHVPVSGLEALKNIKIIEAAIISNKEKRVVAL
jgi:scyllo-inositol 2-dehydrogenase (NADP+)